MTYCIPRFVQWFVLGAASTCFAACSAPSEQPEPEASVRTKPPSTFSNPLFVNGADPWLEYYDGNYYLTTTTWTSQLVMRKSPTLDGLATAKPVNVWSDAVPTRCCNFWAFEFHRLNGPNGWRWYLMYTSGQHGTLDHQHLSVLESAGDDPMGPYTYKGEMMPDSWNIDGSYLEHQGKLYLLWSEWVDDEQLNWISKMTNPWTIEGPRVVLTRPEEEWEKSGRKVNEGAEILKKNGRTFLIYSASFCNTPDYKLAMKELTGDDPMNPDDWTKYPEPVFQRGNGVYGPGHNGFFKSPDGNEDWIVYHGNNKETDGCGPTRSVRAQKFTWTDSGEPDFGEPVPEGEKLDLPSGENGPLITRVQGAPIQLINAASDKCLVTDGKLLVQGPCDSDDSHWIADNTADGHVRFNHVSTGEFMGDPHGGSRGDSMVKSAWENTLWQRWTLKALPNGLVTIANSVNDELVALDDCSATEGEIVYSESSECAAWRLRPAGSVAVASVQSGRLLQACSEDGNVNQGSFEGRDCQGWQFTPTELGYFKIQPSGTEQCLGVMDHSIVPGQNVQLAQCDEATSQWQLQWRTDGAVKIVNRESGQALNLDSCGLAEGTNFSQAPQQDNICQQFTLREIP